MIQTVLRYECIHSSTTVLNSYSIEQPLQIFLLSVCVCLCVYCYVCLWVCTHRYFLSTVVVCLFRLCFICIQKTYRILKLFRFFFFLLLYFVFFFFVIHVSLKSYYCLLPHAENEITRIFRCVHSQFKVNRNMYSKTSPRPFVVIVS